MKTTCAPIDWETETVSQTAQRAARRAIEAISRVGTLTADLATANARIDALEAQAQGFDALLGAMLAEIDRRLPQS